MDIEKVLKALVYCHCSDIILRIIIFVYYTLN